jgi:hypothetical protein
MPSNNLIGSYNDDEGFLTPGKIIIFSFLTVIVLLFGKYNKIY